MSRGRYKFGENTRPHFLTCTVVAWLPIFAQPDVVEIILESWRFLQRHERLAILGYVILENHLHLIAAAADLSKEIGDFKSFTARKILDLLQDRGALSSLEEFRTLKARHKADREYQLWQEGSHPQMILDEAMLRQKLDYIHYNPVKRGYVDDPVHWRYSSARTYAGQPGLIEVEMNW